MNSESIPDQSFTDSPSRSHEQAGAESFVVTEHQDKVSEELELGRGCHRGPYLPLNCVA